MEGKGGEGRAQKGREEKKGVEGRGGGWERRGAPPFLILQFNYWTNAFNCTNKLKQQ